MLKEKKKIEFKLPTLEDIANKITSINPELKAAFIASAIFFFIIHGGFFDDRLVNEDFHHDIYGWGHLANLPLGRIFGNIYILTTNSWTIGVVSCIYMSIASVLIVDLFKIKTKTGTIVASALMTGFPGLAYMYGYLMSAHMYSRQVLLCALAVWITYKRKNGYLFGAFLFMIAMGMGQSALNIGMVLCALMLLREIADCQSIDKEFYKKVFKFLIMGVIGVFLYFIVLQFALHITNVHLSSYKGINDMGKVTITQIIEGILSSYQNVFHFYFGEKFFYVSKLQKTAYVVLGGVYLIKGFFFLRNDMKKTIAFLIIVGVLPICIDIFGVVAPLAGTYVVTIYPIVYCIILPIAFFENYLTNTIHKILNWILMIALLFTIYCNYDITSAYYLKDEVINEQTMNFENRLLSRIESYPDFNLNMPVAIISDGYLVYNGIDSNKFYNVINDSGLRRGYIGIGDNYVETKTINLINNYTGVLLRAVSEEQIEEIIKSDEYKTMGVYPLEDGIKIINGILVVNLTAIEVEIEKNSDHNVTIQLLDKTFGKTRKNENGMYAWYVYIDNVRNTNLDRWYENYSEYTFDLTEDGEYKFRCFYRDGDTTKTIWSKAIIVKDGKIIED